MSASPPRLAPLPKEDWGDDAVAALRTGFGDAAAERLLASGPDAPRIPNVLTTLMRHPALTGPFLAYNAVLLNTPTLEPRWRELMVLRVAWCTRATYEWVQHVRIARACGITDDEIDAIASGAADDGWSPLETLLLEATDQLLDQHCIDDDTWARLSAHLDERQLVELVFVVGTYSCLAMAFNSFGLELDPDLETIVAPTLQPQERT